MAVKSRPRPERKRLDVTLVERGLVESRQRAQGMILAGQVLVDRQKVEKAGAQVPANARIELLGETPRYASRGGLKLEGALQDFRVSPAGKACLDVGSSTGGFTDCLLQHGAAQVYAVDVNVRQMAWRLQHDRRVVPLERNARFLKFEDVGALADLVTIDVSFISVAKVLPALVPLARPGADFLILIKPQFELEKKEVGSGGIVRDPCLQEKAVERARSAATAAGLRALSLAPSRLAGAEGNQEFFLHARRETLG